MDITLIYLLVYASLLLFAGYMLPSISRIEISRALGWSIAVITVVFSHSVTVEKSALYRMVSIVSLQLLSMKLLVMIEAYRGKPKLTFFKWLMFSLGWFGMRPVLFESFGSRSLDFIDVLWRGFSRIIVGFLLLYFSIVSIDPSLNLSFIDKFVVLLGLSFVLHFGVLNISTALWRSSGVDVRELFKSPYKSKSLAEFWGKRWNMAFSEMTALIAYRPLKTPLGKTGATIISFLLSGLLHEIAISLPVKKGYGFPLLYFVIQGMVMLSESQFKIIARITAHRILCHVWVFTWLIIPIPLLFHDEFFTEVLFPLRDLLLFR